MSLKIIYCQLVKVYTVGAVYIIVNSIQGQQGPNFNNKKGGVTSLQVRNHNKMITGWQ
jgi:hypothetical protein